MPFRLVAVSALLILLICQDVWGEAKATIERVRAQVDSLGAVLNSTQQEVDRIHSELDSLEALLAASAEASNAEAASGGEASSNDASVAAGTPPSDPGESTAADEVAPPSEEKPGAETESATATEAAVEVVEPQIVLISEVVGSEIDAAERKQFGLFKSVDGFRSATYLKRPDGTYAVRLTLVDGAGKEYQKTNSAPYAGIAFVRSRIEKNSSE